MDELQELRKQIEARDYDAAIAIVNELEEMSREDKINKIFSFSLILWQHLIKREAEGRTTNSWEASIKEAATQIQRINTRRRVGSTYLSDEGLHENLKEALPLALAKAAAEAFGGALDVPTLEAKVNQSSLLDAALQTISTT